MAGRSHEIVEVAQGVGKLRMSLKGMMIPVGLRMGSEGPTRTKDWARAGDVDFSKLLASS